MESKNNTKIHGKADCQPEPIQGNQLEYNTTAAMLEPQVIAAQPQPLISSQSQTT